MKVRLIQLWQSILCLSIFVTVSVFSQELDYQELADTFKAGETPTVETGAQVNMESLKLSQQLENIAGVEIPGPVSQLINAIEKKTLRDVSMKKNTVAEADESFIISGTVNLDLFNKLKGELSLRVITARIDGQFEKGVELYFPKNWKLRDMFPDLEKSPIGSVPLPDGQIILSTFDYTDEEDFQISKGVNIAAHVSLEEVAPELHEAIDKLRPKNSGFAQSVAFEGFEDVRLNANITRDIQSTSFDVIVPLRIGVDFETMQKEGVITRKPSGIRRITTGNIKAVFVGAKQEAGFECGVKIYPTTQESPLDLQSQVRVSPNALTMMARMDGTWDPAITDWLALDNPAFEINFDFTLMSELAAAGIPIPFTGLKIRGGLGFGPQDAQTSVDLAAGIEISDDPRDLDFAMEGKLDRVSFKQIVDLFGRISKKKVPLSKLPDIEFSDVKLYVVPKDMTIAERAYEAGFAFGGRLQIQQFKGKADVALDSEGREIALEGYLAPLKLGKALVITGKGEDEKLGTDDDQAKLKFTFPPRADAEALMELDGVVRIPVLDFQQTAVLSLGQDSMRFTSGGKIAGVDGEVSGTIYPNQLDATKIGFSITTAGMKQVASNAIKALNEWRERAKRTLEDARKKIENAKKKYEGEVEQEQKRIENEMKKLREQFENAKKECDATSWIKKWTKKECYQQVKLKTEMLVKEKIYKDFLLEKGKKLGKVMSVPGTFIDQANKAEKYISYVNKAIEQFGKADKIKEISGEFDVAYIKQGNLPKLSVKLAAGKEFTLDYTPKELAKNIASKALAQVV